MVERANELLEAMEKRKWETRNIHVKICSVLVDEIVQL